MEKESLKGCGTILAIILGVILFCWICAGCPGCEENYDDDYSSSYSGGYSSSSSSSSYDDYDYDKGYGYEAPKKGQSFSDYVKEQDPDLYNSIKDIYDSLQ